MWAWGFVRLASHTLLRRSRGAIGQRPSISRGFVPQGRRPSNVVRLEQLLLSSSRHWEQARLPNKRCSASWRTMPRHEVCQSGGHGALCSQQAQWLELMFAKPFVCTGLQLLSTKSRAWSSQSEGKSGSRMLAQGRMCSSHSCALIAARIATEAR